MKAGLAAEAADHQPATYLSSGKDGDGELQQALDLDLHGAVAVPAPSEAQLSITDSTTKAMILEENGTRERKGELNEKCRCWEEHFVSFRLSPVFVLRGDTVGIVVTTQSHDHPKRFSPTHSPYDETCDDSSPGETAGFRPFGVFIDVSAAATYADQTHRHDQQAQTQTHRSNTC
ncbi:hypothetical protein EYF80_018236 [Liparis tanakae]|uniref:Uncharacterized protein n=1 Tax=Liparis tanakae TaxID=230148 RepID=A0A4Z2I168_9TELE|nr:hypothetical protein EYF80_018236 [Liparis tanakae]